MARPNKLKSELHSERLNLWLTEDQAQLIEKLSQDRDIPKGIAARECLLAGLALLVAQQTLPDSRAA